MTWAVVGACLLGAIILLPLAEPRRRLAVDIVSHQVQADLQGPVEVHDHERAAGAAEIS